MYRNCFSARTSALLRILVVLSFAAASAAVCAAQPAKTHPAKPLPRNPAALLALVAQHNGLTGSGLKPWHIKATYQLYNAKGHPTQKGIFEEWWQGPKEYKLIFQRPGFHVQLVGNAKGNFVSSNSALPYPEYLVRLLYLDPVSPKLPAKGMKFHRKTERFGSASLNCVEEVPRGLHPTRGHNINPAFPTYCMDPSTLMLRVFGSYGQSTTEIVTVDSLDGRYIAGNAVIFDSGRKYLTVHLDKGESAPHWSPSLFRAPLGATLIPAKTVSVLNVNEKNLYPRRISGKNPVYPISARMHHQDGKVLLSALIGRDGRIHSLVVTYAPSITLAESLLAAVKTWRYKPYFFHGRPVKVQTLYKIIYTLGGD